MPKIQFSRIHGFILLGLLIVVHTENVDAHISKVWIQILIMGLLYLLLFGIGLYHTQENITFTSVFVGFFMGFLLFEARYIDAVQEINLYVVLSSSFLVLYFQYLWVRLVIFKF